MNGPSGSGNFLEKTLGANLGIESEHSLFYLGLVYDTHFYNPTLGGNATQDILIVIPNTIGFFHLFSVDAKMTSAPATVFLYENPTTTGNGTPVIINQLNRASSNVAATSIFSGPTVTGVGTQIHFDLITGSPNSGGATNDFTYPDHMVLKPNMNYLFRVTSGVASVQALAMHIAWYEWPGPII